MLLLGSGFFVDGKRTIIPCGRQKVRGTGRGSFPNSGPVRGAEHPAGGAVPLFAREGDAEARRLPGTNPRA